MLDLHRLRLLTEFAARGSIAKVAAALGYTPSAVSQQLAALEREAGTALLDRTARRAELTDAGRRLAGHAERILAMVEEAETDLSARGAAVDVAVVDDWTGRLADEIEMGGSILSCYHLVRDPLVLVVPRSHPAADPGQMVDL